MEVGRQGLRQAKRSPQLVKSWEQDNNKFYLHCPQTSLEIIVCSARVFRFRFSPEGFFEHDFSYALEVEEGYPTEECYFELVEVQDEYHILTDCITCKISKTLHISIFNKEGKLISEDERGFHWERHEKYGGNIVYSSKKIQEQESFFGLGDKPNVLNLRGLRFENWGSDTYGFEKTTDPLYKNIPFFMGLHNKLAYGIFFDNSFRTRFDFGHERGDVCSFWSKGGEMNYYFIYGPELTEVVESFAFITGKPELPPLWSLGYHQSKWSYYPEERLKEIAAQLREEKIPCDAIHIDIDYMDGFRCFTWDSKRFPDPERMTAELETDGFKTVVIIDPGIKIDKDYDIYKEAVENKYFCRRADGPLMRGEVWPGLCHFPDFTDPRVREWWSGLFEKFMEAGMHGVWNDMNEPALMDIGTFPNDTRHNYDGHPCSHRKAHNVYGMQMARATYHGIKKAMFPRRPFALSRSGYAGIQRYAAVWTGDNLATWEHLWMANIQVQRLSISGVSFAGSDIGGFIGDSNGELYTRWMQMAAFHPFCRAHSSKDYTDQEPWSFGQPYTAAIKKAIELRYQILPYLYTVFWRHAESGTPMIRPLVFLDQDDEQTYHRMEEFALGNNLLICPIARAGADGRYMYLPKGQWYNYWTDELLEGGKEVWVDSDLETFPFFVRAGTILPQYPVMQYVGEKQIESLDLHVYLSENSCTSELYEDAGDFYDYDQGNYRLRSFIQLTEKNRLYLQQLSQGRFNSEYSTYRIIVHGLTFTPAGFKIDGKQEMFEEVMEDIPEVFIFEVDKGFEELELLTLSGFAAD